MEQIKHGLDLSDKLAFEEVDAMIKELGITQEQIDAIDLED